MIEEIDHSEPNTTVGSDQPFSNGSLLIRSILFGLTFWGTALGSRYLTVSSSIYVPFWFPSSVYLAVLLLNPVRTWPCFLVAAFIANAAFDLPQGTPITALIGFYVSNSSQVLVAAWLIGRHGELQNALRNLGEFVKLVGIIAGVAPFIGALLGAGTLVASRLSPSFLDAWATWFANAALADLLVVPLALAWVDKSKKISELDLPYQFVQFSILAIGMVITACYVFVMVDGIMSPYKSFLLFFLLLSAIRLDLRGVTLMNLSLGILAAFFTAHFQVGLTPRDIASGTYIGVLQGFLAVATLVALLPAIVIAERDGRTAELLNSQQRTRLATETTGVGIWEWNLENGDVKWDAAMFRIYGIAPTSDGFVRYETWRECVDPDELAEQETILQDTIRTLGQSQRQFHIRRRNDRQLRLIRTKETVRLDAGGKAAYLVGTNIDVTDWHEINSRLQDSVNLLHKLSDQVPGVFYQFLLRPDGNSSLPYASEGIRSVFEVSPEEVRESASAVTARIHPDDSEKVIASRKKSMELLAEWRCEFRVQLPMRGERWLEGHSVPEKLPDGSILWHGYIRDVTDRKQLESRFLQSQKMEAIGRLAGGVAHDFNNLLTVINGFSDIVLSNLAADDPSYTFVESILDAGRSGATLTAQLLAFGRKTVVTPTLFDLNDAVIRSEKLLRRLIGEHITLNIVTAPSECTVNADPNQLDQVILNLAVNARDAMPSGGELTVRVLQVTIEADEASTKGPSPGAYVQLSVSDTGCGMSAEVQERIFEPFFTTKDPGKGTGLGLSTVYGIVKQSGGLVTFESQLRLGSVFRIWLPYASLPVLPLAKKTPMADGGTETVLLVEDDPAVRAISSVILKSQGYSVIEASCGQEALEIFREQQGIIDILLTDVVMPGMNGQELADAVCGIRPGFPVICVSGYTNDYLDGQMGGAPRYAFLQKPFTPDALSQKIRELLDPQRQNVSALSN